MHALVKGAAKLELREIPDPIPKSGELLVRVRAVSLNRGELRGVALAKEGVVPGWDIAGTVVETGERVAGILTGGGWAELAAVARTNLATIPEGVSFAAAASLPVAALTAYRALSLVTPLLGRRVLITGASGGVGRFAVQLARRGGAHVTGIVSSARAGAVRALGASETTDSIEAAPGEYDLILESVGGASLAQAVERVAAGGVVVTIGNSSEEPTTFNARSLYRKSGATIHGLLIFEEVAQRRTGSRELAHLLELVRDGALDPGLAEVRSWREFEVVLRELEERKISGKAILEID